MSTRNGKIARLPFEIREELNHRLLENEPARNIAAWLNSQPTVRLFIDRLFEGRPITEQNISEWRKGGYEEWLAQREVLANVSDLTEKAARTSFTGISAEHLLLVLTASYAELLQRLDTTPEIAFNRRLIVLQHLTKTALAMRRSEQRDARLQLDRERIEILREKHPDTSPSSFSSHASSDSIMRHSYKYPCDPKAPAIRHYPANQPVIPREPADRSDDRLRPSSTSSSHPHASGASPHNPSVAAVSAAPAPTPTASCVPPVSLERETGSRPLDSENNKLV
jgi:hypothetical protein